MRGVPSEVQQACRRILGDSVSLDEFRSIAGGCINHGGKLTTSAGDFFLKWNDTTKLPGMFEAEAKGLDLLKRSCPIYVPAVVGWFQEQAFQGILLGFVESKKTSSSYWQELGHDLALMHRNSNEYFGLDHSNYIGSLAQANVQAAAWNEFFVEQRLEVQLKLAIESGSLNRSITRAFQNLYKELPSIFPGEKPALLHGDLWSGNVIVNHVGKPCLIDPAVYYGHREAELSFTKLFGGFDHVFYHAYHESFSLSPGLEQRMDIYNLYPLLVHVNLFGGGYIRQVQSIIKRFE